VAFSSLLCEVLLSDSQPILLTYFQLDKSSEALQGFKDCAEAGVVIMVSDGPSAICRTYFSWPGLSFMCDCSFMQVSDDIRHGILGLYDFSVCRFQISDQQVNYRAWNNAVELVKGSS